MSLPAVAQSTEIGPAVTASIALVLGGAPTSGNVLVAFINYGQFGTPRTVTPPAGTWTKYLSATQTNDSIDVWWHPVVGGDGATWTFTLNDGGEFASAEMYEVSGSDISTPFNGAGATSKNASTSSLATGSITPSALNCLALSGQVQDDSGSNFTTVGSGWTIDENAWVSGHGRGGNAASRNALTSDTTTAISTTWTITTGPAEALTAIVLVQPPLAVAPVTDRRHGNQRPFPFTPSAAQQRR